MTVLLAVFMAVNMLTSALALARYDARTSGEAPKSSIDMLLEDVYKRQAQQAHDEQQNRNEHSFLLLFLAEQQ